MSKYLDEMDEEKFQKASESDKNWISLFTREKRNLNLKIDDNLPMKELAEKLVRAKKIVRKFFSRRINIINEDEILKKYGDNKEFMETLRDSDASFFNFVANIGPTLATDLDFMTKTLLIYNDKFYCLNPEYHTEELIDWLIENKYRCMDGVNVKFKTVDRMIKELEYSSFIFKELPETLRDNEEFVRPYIEKESMLINFVSDRLLSDKEFILSFKNLRSLMNIDQKLFEDEDFVFRVLEINEDIFSSLPDNIKYKNAHKLIIKNPYTIFYNLTDEMIADTELMLSLVDSIEGDSFITCSLTSYSMRKILENPVFNEYMMKHNLRKPGETLSFLGEATLFQVASFIKADFYKKDIKKTPFKKNINKF